MIKRIFFLFVISLLFIFSSCEETESINALVIIFGRHANANAFSDYYYEEGLRKPIWNTILGGYIGVIIGDGNPKVVERFDFFNTDATSERLKDDERDNYTEIVLADLKKEEKFRAEIPENDLLKAIQEAHRLLNVFEDKAKNEEKKIKNKQIIIMDNGIVTAGDMNFLRLNIDSVLFRQSDEFPSKIIENLDKNRLIPDLKGIDVVFIGLGDVADPQEELSNSVKYDIERLWTAFFNKSNAKSIAFRDYPRGTIANNEGFPPVSTIKFEQAGISIVDGPVPITIDFIANSAEYLNQENAEILLGRQLNDIIYYLDRRPEVKIYVVGSMARESLERDYSTDLSERRANTVKESLIKLGVPENRLEAFGLGEFYPDREDEFKNGVFNEDIARNNRKVVLLRSDLTDQVNEVLSVRADLSRRW